MEELVSFLLFLLIMALIIFRQFLIDRQNKKKREETCRQQSPRLSSESEPEPDAYQSHQIKPPSPSVSQPVPKVETPIEIKPRYGFETNIDGRKLTALLQEHHLTADLQSLETSELVSTRFAGEYKELSTSVTTMSASYIGFLLQSRKSMKDVILLSEILKNPYL